MKDLGEIKKILGMAINRYMSTSRFWLSQENYVLKMLDRFNMAEASRSLLFWQITANYPPVSVQTHKKRRMRCLNYHMLVRWDH